MFAPITLVTKAYRPSLLFTANTLSALLLIVSALPAQAAKMDTITVSASNDSAVRCADESKVLQSKRQKYLSARRSIIDCKLMELKRYQAKHSVSSCSVDQAARQQYLVYKAQAWLNYATYEDSINSHSAAGTQALQAADTILQALKTDTDQDLTLNPDIPSSSALMRPDLWAILTALKDSGGINDAPRELAFSEVGLVWAAADHCTHGARQSGPHFRMADRWLEQAREAYVNAHDTMTNVALEQLTNRYYKKYAPLDPSDDICRGQTLSLDTQDTNNTQELVTNNALNNTGTLGRV